MSAFADIMMRTDAILEKYEHYDAEATPGRSTKRKKSDDPFSDKYFEIMDRVQELHLKSESLVGEKNRALKAALNAELRKEKALLLDEIPNLHQLVRGKGVTPDMERERLERLAEAKQAVDDIMDGGPSGSVLKPQRSGLNGSSSAAAAAGGQILIDGSNLRDTTNLSPGAYEHTMETAEFVRDATIAKERQDMALENIERGLSTLKELGEAMGEELERHDVIIDEVEAKMDTVTREMQTNNARLKGLVTQIDGVSIKDALLQVRDHVETRMSASASERTSLATFTTPTLDSLKELEDIPQAQPHPKTSWFSESAPQILRNILLIATIVTSSTVAIIGFFTLSYLLATHALTPKQLYYTQSLPLDISGNDLVSQISLNNNNYATAMLPASHRSSSTIPPSSSRFLSPGQSADIWVDIILPKSFQGRKSSGDMAHLVSELLSEDGALAARATKPVLLHGRPSSLLSLLLSPLHWISGMQEGTYTISIQLFSNYKDLTVAHRRSGVVAPSSSTSGAAGDDHRDPAMLNSHRIDVDASSGSSKNRKDSERSLQPPSHPPSFSAFKLTITSRIFPAPDVLGATLRLHLRVGIIRKVLYCIRPNYIVTVMLGAVAAGAVMLGGGISALCIGLLVYLSFRGHDRTLSKDAGDDELDSSTLSDLLASAGTTPIHTPRDISDDEESSQGQQTPLMSPRPWQLLLQQLPLRSTGPLHPPMPSPRHTYASSPGTSPGDAQPQHLPFGEDDVSPLANNARQPVGGIGHGSGGVSSDASPSQSNEDKSIVDSKKNSNSLQDEQHMETRGGGHAMSGNSQRAELSPFTLRLRKAGSSSQLDSSRSVLTPR